MITYVINVNNIIIYRELLYDVAIRKAKEVQ